MAEQTATPPVGDGSPQERFGPLALMRVRKDDGRALILYSHREDGPDAQAAGETRASGEAGGRAGAPGPGAPDHESA